MIDKIKASFRKFWRNRYGWDRLNGALYIVGLILLIVAMIVRERILSDLSMILLVIAIFRALSKNRGKRRKENARFSEILSPFKTMWVRFKNRKIYRYVHCPSCNKVARVPKGKGKVSIRCPYCHFTYERRV
ncbi:MAG: hypothetical protein SPI65_03960 [Peptoniphilus sp.]|nr:hypothetical protein [Peptoniphilus sp.]MDD7363635.1 hypothetical protein [Bacillota bacterium]MDY6044719.1 hypothetical protein [Peptoniphilus sp.]